MVTKWRSKMMLVLFNLFSFSINFILKVLRFNASWKNLKCRNITLQKAVTISLKEQKKYYINPPDKFSNWKNEYNIISAKWLHTPSSSDLFLKSKISKLISHNMYLWQHPLLLRVIYFWIIAISQNSFNILKLTDRLLMHSKTVL